MDDSEYVCPLCCEEMDISDQQFYPCKCGYQVCMWCWHRIKEQESGLCPACRTPYGDDPHEFSAVDVEEVLKAKREKEAAEREKKRNSNYDGNSLDGEGLPLAGMKGQMDVPRDRSQLANMRVIRRNLVYAVGLPIAMATEEILRKPDYFGQYGKIAKIVLNRSQATAADPRRASASAYVTFTYKEDTLACILALDGFYIEGRSVRASYGTSKYCSAFIKNVRCNNPECTYLHTMGDAEDTFTKQEIQAGYVTSGRDVLARQQEIVQQALSSATGGALSRRKVGGGGPSGTGKAGTNPVFPPPSFDEPIKPAVSTQVPSPQLAPGRSLSSGAAFPTIAAANAQVNASGPIPAGPGKVIRSSSSGSVGSTGSMSGGPIPKGSIGGGGPALKSKGSIVAAPPVPPRRASTGISAPPVPNAVSAASVVAGVHSVSTSLEPPAPHTTLTPLTPLKRSTGSSSKASETTKLTSLRAAGTRKPATARAVSASAAIPMAPPAGVPVSNRSRPEVGIGGIGGTVIAAPIPVGNPISRGPTPPVNNTTGRLSELGGDALGGLGGEVFNGPLKSAPIGAPGQAGMDKWNSVGLGGDPVVPSNSGGFFGGAHQSMPGSSNYGQIGGVAIGGGNHSNGSSALASMLGISLPTGSGSLHESTSQWMGPTPGSQQAPISALNGSSAAVGGGVIGGPGISHGNGNGSIGGVTIGGPSPMPPGGPIGGNGNKSDIALLQSLLPGVHITTSGGSYATQQDNAFGSVGRNPNASQGQYWEGNLQSNLRGQPMGTIGGGTIGSGVVNQNQRQAPGSIW
ncbi:unnamed protein product [Cylindrotheca closterium]|uniref:CCR4-NOT transcription complex subunit 4 n=1 Tax=Cylindrotheca closterium TaxID=2856 RepID=A0AAD2FAV6_9STRA|nr:unnamed protein product [Cylindrotheca closterium]